MADLRISDLPELSAGLQGDDPVAIVDVSASTTKKIKASVLVLDAIKGLPDNSIPDNKVDFAGLPANSVGTTELKDKSVTAAKLADNSSAVVAASAPTGSGAFIGQLFVTTSPEKEIYAWNGSSWVHASGLVSAEGSTAGLVNTYVSTVGDKATISADIDNTTSGGQFLAGPAGSAGAVSARSIASTDLPTAGTQKGAVAVNGNGLKMVGDAISLSKGVASSAANQLVTFDSEGLVIDGVPIGPSDLPISSDGSVGAVQPVEGIAVDATGTISIDNAVVGATFPKITYNNQGLVTGGQNLVADDIPDLGTSKITEGVFGSSFIDEDAITMSKMADLSTAYIQEAQPNIANPQNFIGAFWYQESTAQLRISNGLSWRAVGFGALSADNLRWGGVIDATTGFMTGVTQAGSTAGLTIGAGLPTATNDFGGLYVVVGVGGSSIGVTPGVSYSPGNWCLCVSASEGWIKIENVGGGGGGGGATNLGDLLDVTLTSETEGDWLQLQSTGQWTNIDGINGGTF